MLNANELKEFKWSVDEYIKYGEKNALDHRWMKQLENASARFHISRLEALKIQTQQVVEKLYGNHLDDVDDLIRNVYTDNLYHAAFEIQKGFGVGSNFAKVDENKLSKILSKPWTVDGRNFDERIWTNKQKLINELHTELTQMCVLGKSPEQSIERIANRMNVSYGRAKTLVMTETAYFTSISDYEAFKRLGVEKYEILATLDSLTSQICQDMDGEVFELSEFEVGVTAHPFHPNCRTVEVPAFDDDFEDGGERAARSEDGKTYYVPESMKYHEWKESFVDGGSKDDLNPIDKGDKIKVKKNTIKNLDKLKSSGMNENDFNEFLSVLNNHDNPLIRNVYALYADQIKQVKYKSGGAAYQPSANTLSFNYPVYDDMDKFSTLAHEYGHFFDAKVPFDGLHFKEIKAVRDLTGMHTFESVASSSDEFLEAIRKDKEHIKSIFTPELKQDLFAHNASSGVQDAIDGLFANSRIRWGHGEKYYNRKYSDIVFIDKLAGSSLKKELQKLYNELGLDASNQNKAKLICRQYEAASEAWANIMSAEVCGGESLEYVKKYLPNSYKAILEILKGVK